MGAGGGKEGSKKNKGVAETKTEKQPHNFDLILSQYQYREDRTKANFLSLTSMLFASFNYLIN